jgi:uncharacterized protein
MFFHWNDSTLILKIKVTPNASRDEFGEILNEQIKLKLKAPPVDGKANAYLIKFLAKTFRTRKNQVTICNGQTSKNKTIKIDSPQLIPGFLK